MAGHGEKKKAAANAAYLATLLKVIQGVVVSPLAPRRLCHPDPSVPAESESLRRGYCAMPRQDPPSRAHPFRPPRRAARY